jgi:putative ABC transport system permease protein
VLEESTAWRTIKLGIKNLLLNKLRSFLTMGGMFFGVASVIAMLAIGEGASYEQQEQIKALGSNNIIVESVKPPQDENQQGSMWNAQDYGLTYEDAETIAATLPRIKVVVPVREMPKRILFNRKVVQAPILGTVPRYMDVTSIQVAEGRFIVQEDVDRKRNVAVLGSELARRITPLDSPLGKPIGIGVEAFTIVGVLEAPGEGKGGKAATQAKEGLFVPLSAARAFFGELIIKSGQGSREMERVQLHRIQVQVEETEDVITTADALRSLMAMLHKEPDYKIEVPLELLRQVERTARQWKIILALIAGISLIVGGIGIMNVMLATVTERTREIGIRRALGAKRHHIVSQFLVETVVLSCFGGLLGIVGGWVVPVLVTHYTQQVTILQPSFAILAFCISAAVGILAGLYPAWRAAQMDPVEALRHE